VLHEKLTALESAFADYTQNQTSEDETTLNQAISSTVRRVKLGFAMAETLIIAKVIGLFMWVFLLCYFFE